MASTIPALYGLGSDAVPSDVLGKLIHSVLYSESKAVDDRTSDITCAYVNALGSGYASKTAPSYDAESGEYKFSGQTYRCTGASWGDGYKATSKGTSWAYQTLQNDNSIKYYIPDDAKNTYIYIATVYAGSGSDMAYFYPEKPAKLYEKVTVVDSELKTVLGDLIYVPANQIYGGVKIATGSYTGTGTHGASNPNSITFEFVPKIVLVSPPTNTYKIIWMTGVTIMTTNYINANYATVFSLAGKTLTWYARDNTSADSQLNISGTTYNYIAIC